MKQKTIIVIILILVALLGIYIVTNTDTTSDQASTPTVQPVSSQPASEDSVDYEQSKNLIAGEWQSTQDPNAYKVFDADGTAIERYAGERPVETVGTWRLFSTDDPVDSYQQSLDMDTTYLRIDDSDEQYHYSIITLDENTLELIYLGRGGVLQYQRVVN